MIVAFAAAGASGPDGRSGNHGGGFAAIWSMFLMLAYIGSGTYILREHKTPSAIGVLLGSGFMVSNTFFTLFCIFAGFANEAREAGNDPASTADGWFAANAFFICLATLVFTLILGKFRNEIIPVENMNDADGAAAENKKSLEGGVNKV